MTGLSHATSEFDRFLFALLGEEDEVSLSVVSVLAQQDMDPWQEAARLSQLSLGEATNSLASTIWKTDSKRWSPSEASLLAGRLIELLPSSQRRETVSRRIDSNESQFVMWLIYGILLGTIAISGQNTSQSARNTNNSAFTTNATNIQPGPLRDVSTD